MSDQLKSTENAEQKIALLFNRLLAIQLALQKGTIKQKTLLKISQLSVTELEKYADYVMDKEFKPKPKNIEAELKAFFNLIQDESTLTLNIRANKETEEALLEFEQRHGDYLLLLPLASENRNSIANALNELALLYLNFGAYIQAKPKKDKGSIIYDLSFAEQEAKLAWKKWVKERPPRLMYPSDRASMARTGVVEKFLLGVLGHEEWLTDLDIQRGLKIFGLNEGDAPVNVVRFDPKEIGLALHFAREKYVSAQQPYHIPLIINLGANQHQSIDDSGAHWVRMLVTVDPASKTIEATYTDSMYIEPAAKNKINELLQKAFAYREETGSYTDGTHKTYSAFSDYQIKKCSITSTGEQKDGYTCGYHAIKDTIKDLAKYGVFDKNKYKRLLDCQSSPELVRYMYYHLLTKQELTQQQHEVLEKNPLFNGTSSVLEVKEKKKKPKKEKIKIENAPTKKPYFISTEIVSGYLAELEKFPFQHRVKRNKQNALQDEKGIKSQFNSDELKRAAENHKFWERLLLQKTMKQIQTHTEANLTLGIGYVIETIQEDEDDIPPHTIIQAIFKLIAANPKIKAIELDGNLNEETEQQVKLALDDLTTVTKIQCESLQEIVEAISLRNQYISMYGLHILKDPWHAIFQKIIFDPPQQKTTDLQIPLEFNSIMLDKLFTYLEEFQPAIQANSCYTSLSIPETVSGPLNFLLEKIQIQKLPFKCFKLTLKYTDNVLEALKKVMLRQEIKQLTIELKGEWNKAFFIDLLQAIEQEKQFTTSLIFTGDRTSQYKQEIIAIENALEINRRNIQSNAPHEEVKPSEEQVMKIPEDRVTRAIWGSEIKVGIEIQSESQQQQQQQQQVQTVVEEESDVEDETKITDEQFPLCEEDDCDLVNRENIEAKLGKFIQQRTCLSPVQVWDLIAGDNARFFRYGIQHMTTSALKHLIEHIDQIQYGLHLDNLPLGFYVQQKINTTGVQLVLNCNPYCTINSKVSPLTLSLQKPMPPELWRGDMHQFLTQEECEELYRIIYPKPGFINQLISKDERPSIEEVMANFFGLKPGTVLNSKNGCLVLETLLKKYPHGKEIFSKLKVVFGEPLEQVLTLAHIQALAQVIYAGKYGELFEFLQLLQTLKRTKGSDYFTRFKRCFLGPCKNWCELMTPGSLQAIQNIIYFSDAQLAWFQKLTEQHTSGLGHMAQQSKEVGERQTTVPRPELRWANLGDCVNGFKYFQEQLEEIDPSFGLPEYCPLENVADMFVGLERLLVIFKNARDPREQFNRLAGLDLGPLKAAYASRYEGFTLVASEMKLTLGALRGSYSEEKVNSKENCCFRIDNETLKSNIYHLLIGNASSNACDDGTWKDKIRAYFMRYIATFCQRANYSMYKDILDYVVELEDSAFTSRIRVRLLAIIAMAATGKQGKNVTRDQVERLVKQYQSMKKSYFLNANANANANANEYEFARNCIWPWIKILSRTSCDIDTILKINARFIEEIQDYNKIFENCVYYHVQDPRNLLSNIAEFMQASAQAELILRALFIAANNKNAYPLSMILHDKPSNNDLSGYTLTARQKVDREWFVFWMPAIACLQQEGLRWYAQSNSGRQNYLQFEGFENKLSELRLKSEDISSRGPAYKKLILRVLGLFATIDLRKTTDLPKMADLEGLLEAIEKTDSTTLQSEIEIELAAMRLVQQQLPGVCFTMPLEGTTSSNHSSLDTTLQSHMAIIVQEINKISKENLFVKLTVEQKFGKNCEDLLKTKGPSLLLEHLKFLREGNWEGLEKKVADDAKKQIKMGMLQVYSSSVAAFIKRFNNEHQFLVKNLLTGLPNPLKDLDFDAFSDQFSPVLEAVERFLSNLKKMEKNWPEQFSDILKALTKMENKKPFVELADLSQLFFEAIKPPMKFPLLAWSTVFSSQLDFGLLYGLLQLILPQDEDGKASNQYGFSPLELAQVIQIAIATCKENEKYKTVVEALIRLKEDEKSADFFAETLAIISDNSTDITSVLATIEKIKAKLKDTNTIKALLQCYAGQQKAFFAIAELIIKTDAIDFSLILLALKVTKNTDDKLDNIKQFLANKNLENPLVVDRIKALYITEPLPKFDALITCLAKANEEEVRQHLAMLEVTYDTDPYEWRKKDASLEGKQFDNSKFGVFIAGLKDLNYNRPLPLPWQETLNEWLTYINAIGHVKPIRLNPESKEVFSSKTIQAMTQSEIGALVAYYKKQLTSGNLSEEAKIKMQLECIALGREVMYRTSTTEEEAGRFPYPTQLLYLLNVMRQGDNFAAEIATGQGKSTVAALAAFFAWVNGDTVDVCSSDAILAADGLEKNKGFFTYLGIEARLITESSGLDDYQEGCIHYASLADLALYRSRMQLQGKKFPPKSKCTMISDETDFSTLDDKTRYRYAINLDEHGHSSENAYVWIYNALIDFVDLCQKGEKLTKKKRIEKTRNFLISRAKGKQEKQLLQNLEKDSKKYEEYLEIWLYAAGESKKLFNANSCRNFEDKEKEIHYSISTVEEERNGVKKCFSKACVLTNSDANPKASFSDTVQQFLHMRLNEKYKQEIEAKKMHPFKIETEKNNITSLNSNLMLGFYKRRWGMSGTLGSPAEIKELQNKYGLCCMRIPSFHACIREDLLPILTNSDFINDPKKEEEDRINSVVKEIISCLGKVPKGEKSPPFYIICESKPVGDAIENKLKETLTKRQDLQGKLAPLNNGIQTLYGSDNHSPKETQGIIDQAGEPGMITLSTRGRGIDVKPKHPKGLYTIITFVDTSPYTEEDLERAKRQKEGRAGRQDDKGRARLIVKRSSFKEIYLAAKIKRLRPKDVEEAIKLLNAKRNRVRKEARDIREQFDALKDIFYREFSKYRELLDPLSNKEDEKAAKCQNELLKLWLKFKDGIDSYWEASSRSIADLDPLVDYCLQQWFATEDEIKKALDEVTIPLNISTSLQKVKILNKLKPPHPSLPDYQIKSTEKVSSSPQRTKQKSNVRSLSEEAVYAKYNPSSNNVDRKQAALEELEKIHDHFKAPGYQYQWERCFSKDASRKQKAFSGAFNKNDPGQQLKDLVTGVLYLQYKAYRSGNWLACSALHKKFTEIIQWIVFSQDNSLSQQVVDAYKEHRNILMQHQGDHEDRKRAYLAELGGVWNRLMPTQEGKKDSIINAIKNEFIPKLETYRDAWWRRGWVSPDRKIRAESLIGELNKKDVDIKKILKAINEARKKLLQDDKQEDRDFNAGLQGRLFQLLDEMTTKVMLHANAQTLDTCIDTQFAAIGIVLEGFLARLPAFYKNSCLEKFAETAKGTLNDNAKQPQAKYEAFLILFSQIGDLVSSSQNFKDSGLAELYEYLQQQYMYLSDYIDQSDQYFILNKCPEFAFYRAGVKAGYAMLKAAQRMDNESQLLDLGKETGLYYRGYTVKLQQGKDLQIEKLPFALKHAHSYLALLERLEKNIIESSRLPLTQVKFIAVTVEQVEKIANAYQLTTQAMIDGQEITIKLNCDFTKRTVNVDMGACKAAQSKPTLVLKNPGQISGTFFHCGREETFKLAKPLNHRKPLSVNGV